MPDSPLKHLQDAHTLLCKRVLDILNNPDATVQELKLVKEFLKDNKIEALPVPGSAMGAVVQAAAARKVFVDNNDTGDSSAVPAIKFPTFTSFPATDILIDDDPVVVDAPAVLTGDGRRLG